MSFDIEGWVEVTDGFDELIWIGAIRLASLIDVADEVSEQLFGLSKRCVSGEHHVTPLAADRGVPTTVSPEAQSDLQLIRDHEAEHGEGEFGGYTFATWQELKRANLPPNTLARSSWSLIFDFMTRLEADDRFSDDRIRVVVWYSW